MRKVARLLILGFILILAACTPPEPIRIIVTPTQTGVQVTEELPIGETDSVDETEEASSPVPSVIVPVIPTSDVTAVPTLDVTATHTPTVTPTPTPDISATPSVSPTVTETPVVTPMGSVSGIDPADVGLQVNWNMDIPEWEGIVTQARDLGVTWLKVQADWSFLQPDRPDQFDLTFQLFENHMERANRENFRIMISIAKAPDWARSNLQDDGPPDNPEDLANFIRFMLNETKVGDVVDAIEIWNEPNLIREWTGTLPFNGAGYMQLFVPSYNAIREFPRHIDIISAALAPTSNLQGAIDDREYLQQMYNAGFAQYTDLAVGAHPYGWGNPPDARCCDAIPNRGWDDDPHFFFIHNLEELREIMVANGHETVALWVTELGWATWSDLPGAPPEDSEWMLYNTPQLQAEYMLRALQIGGETQWIGPIVLWNLNFADPILVEDRSEIVGYSLVIPDGNGGVRARPLYGQLQAALQPVN